MTDLDRWAVSRLQGVTRTVIDRMDDFDCTTAGREIADYVDQLSNWYVRLNRRRFWDGDRAAFATLRHCLVEVAKLLAPFVPFVTEEIYGNLTGDGDSVHLQDHPEPDPELEDGELEAGVEAAMRAIELGRAARAQAKVKNRQPLARAVIVATEAERVEVERLADVVAAELNVKELEFVSEQEELVSYEVKPNYRALGPRFGKRDAAGRRRDRGARSRRTSPRRPAASAGSGSTSTGTEHALEPDDLTLAMRPLDGYEVEAEAGRAVALALDIDDDLRREGLAREIVHAIQAARKDAGLEVSDRIALTPRRRRRRCSRPRAHTRATSPARRSPPRSPTTATAGRSGRDRRPRASDRDRARTRRADRGPARGGTPTAVRVLVDLDLRLHAVVDGADQLVGAGLLELVLVLEAGLIRGLRAEGTTRALLLDDVVLVAPDPLEGDLARPSRSRRLVGLKKSSPTWTLAPLLAS